MSDARNDTAATPRRQTRRRWAAMALNALLVLAILALLLATWMPAIYDRFKKP